MPLISGEVRDLGARYAQAWSSLSPQAVASFYEKNGRITINGGEPLVGRAAIADMAKGFCDAFPNLIVRMDDFRMAGSNAIFVWTLEGKHSQTGHYVKVGGWEEWILSGNVLVAASRGYFDAVEYERQIANGM